MDRDWFIHTPPERERYLQLLGRALEESDWRCLSHAVMSNHVHLALVAGTHSLESWIRRVHSPFADWMNRAYDRIGCMFVRGPKDIETPPARVGALIAYIHNNPVRAGVVAAPAGSGWTSHRAYLGIEPAPRWLHVDEGLARAGFADREAFDRWVQTHPDERDVVEAIEREDLAPRPIPGAALPEPGTIVRFAAEQVGIPVAQLCSRRRSRNEVLARQVAVYCAAQVGISGVEIAAALGLSQQAVSRAHRRVVEPAVTRIGSAVLERLADV